MLLQKVWSLRNGDYDYTTKFSENDHIESNENLQIYHNTKRWRCQYPTSSIDTVMSYSLIIWDAVIFVSNISNVKVWPFNAIMLISSLEESCSDGGINTRPCRRLSLLAVHGCLRNRLNRSQSYKLMERHRRASQRCMSNKTLGVKHKMPPDVSDSDENLFKDLRTNIFL